MPSSEDMINTENEARELAIKAIIKREGCSENMARLYVGRLSKPEIAKLIGWPHPGQTYSSW
jgi:hypothetical protein